APSISFNGDDNTGIFSPALDSFAISTAGNEALTVNSSGYVGIGTGNPNSPLQIVRDFNTSAIWHMTVQGFTTFSGTDAAYNGGTVFDANFTNAVTGAGYSEKFGFSAAASTADDGDPQV